MLLFIFAFILAREKMEILWLSLQNYWMEWVYSWYSVGRSELSCWCHCVLWIMGCCVNLYDKCIILAVFMCCIFKQSHFTVIAQRFNEQQKMSG